MYRVEDIHQEDTMKGGDGKHVSFSPNLHQGMVNRSPKDGGSDKSMNLPKGPKVGPSENRSKVTENQRTLGPRNA